MNILLTRRFSQSDLDLIQSWGWSFEMLETLMITPFEVKEIPNAEVWVVSSRNSWEVVKKFIDRAPGSIYCVGHWMKEELLKRGKSGISGFENMKKLVTDAGERNFKSILYFCGDEHRPELEEGLKNSPTKISKVITHQSQMTYPVVKGNFDAVFVFSPRSAESLLKNNSFDSKTTFACIGSTTASYLNGQGITHTFTPSYPDCRILLEEFYEATKNHPATSGGPATTDFEIDNLES
jgi:uroporphyrinogen-III synthase